jgi:hypothetical protein
VDPPAFGHANSRLHGIDKCRRVVIGYQFTLFDVGHEGVINNGTTLAKGCDFVARQDARRAEGFGAEQLHFEHRVESVFVAEEGGDILG